nr:response regulator transcription factor [uncultured Faecalibacillus sp.]
MYSILLIEDDVALNKAISVYFKKENFQVDSFFCGHDMIDALEKNNFDIIILDINLPDLSGFDLIKQIKLINSNIPVIILSACDLDSDILHGFNLGAEDYVTKPFNIEILHKKINVILKRNTKNTFYKDDHLFFDKNTSKLVIDNKEIKLTPLEFKLLSLFLENQNQIILKETIIEKIWDSNENYVDEHTLLVNISRLRNKIEDDKHHYIKTVYGLGYRWCQDE